MTKKLFLLVFATVISAQVFADSPTDAEKLLQSYKDTHDGFSGQPTMNGIRYLDYIDFFSWNLVTVRYRQDNSEQRFTYANKLAWESLNKKSTDYPDGSVFVKVGYIGQPDPAFESSVVPSGLRRVQVMLRDKVKYKSTDGWGYALFKFDGTTMSGDPSEKAESCAACHRIVPDRGYVFSQPIERQPIFNQDVSFLDKKKAWFQTPPSNNLKKVISFEEKPVSSIPEDSLLRQLLPTSFKNIRLVKSELTGNSFVGNFNEIIPSLVKEAEATKMPAAMIHDRDRKFSMVYPLKHDTTLKCKKGAKPFYIAMATPPFYLPNIKQGTSLNLEVRRACLDVASR